MGFSLFRTKAFGSARGGTRPERYAWILAASVFAAGLAATAGYVLILSARDEHDSCRVRDRLAHETSKRAEERLVRANRELHAVRGAFLASDGLSRCEFQQLFPPHDVGDSLAGVDGIGIAQRLTRNEVATLEREMRDQGAPGFSVSSSGDRPTLAIVRLLKPEKDGLIEPGIDLEAHPDIREAAEHSMRTGLATLTPPIAGPVASAHGPGALLLLPVYAAGHSTDTPEERRAACRGWVFATLAESEIPEGEPHQGELGLQAKIRDIAADARGGRWRTGRSLAEAHDTHVRPLRLGEREFLVVVDSAGTSAALGHRIWLVEMACLGVLASAMLAGLVRGRALVGERATRLAGAIVSRLTASKMSAEAAVREISALRAALDQHSLVSIADARGRIIDANTAFCRVSGFTREELLGQDHRVLNSGHHPKAFWVEMWRTISGGRAWRAEVCNRAKDGSLYWVDSTIVPCFGPDGRIEKYVSIRLDITAKKAAEAENRMLADVARRTRNGAVLTDERGRIRWCNEGFCRISGYRLDEIIGKPPGRVLQGQGTDREQAKAMGEAIRAGRGCVAELVNYHKNGTAYTVRVEIEPLHDESGRLTGFLGIETDVTAEREASRRLERSEQFLRQTIAALDTHVAILDKDARVVVVNEAWHKFAAENGGKNVAEGSDYVAVCLNALDADRNCEGAAAFLAAMETALKGNGAPAPVEYECHGPDEKRWFQAVVRRIEVDGELFVVVAHQNVTRLQQVRAELEEGRQRLQMALAGGDLGLWDWNPCTGTVVYDERWASMLGHRSTDLRPDISEWSIRVHPDDLRRAHEALDAHFRGEVATYECEFRMRHADGGYRWILARGRVMERDERNRPVRVVGTHADSTERREAEKLLRESEERHRTLVNTLAEGVVMQDAAGRVVACNASARRILGLSEDQLMGRTSMDARWEARDEDGAAIPGDEHPAMISLRTGRPVQRREMQIRRTDGSDVWIRVSSDVVKDSAGTTTLAVSSFAEITAERMAQRALADERARLEMFVAHAPAAIAMFDTEMRYVSASRQWSDDYSLGGVPLVGRSHYDVFPGLPERWREIHRRCLAGAVERNDDDCWRPPGFDRDQHLRWEIRPWRDTDGRVGGLIMFTQDITEVVERERELARLREAAETASRAKSEFLANVSHEMRTPLTAILGYADLMAETDDPEQARRHVGTVRSAGSHLLTVINDVLDLSKIEAGRLSVEALETDLPALLRELDSIMRPRAEGKGVRLEMAVDGELPLRIRTDPTRLRQILMNLLGNACKFTEEGWVRVRASAEGGRLLVDVEDTGGGISIEQAGRLFEAFSQADASTSRRFGGTGLGLTISRRLANLMGGDVVLVRSTPGRGSLFRASVTLDPVPGTGTFDRFEPGELPQPAATGAEGTRLSGRVLLAEDGPDNQRLIAHHLRKAGATVEIADNGRIALEMISKAAGDGRPYDLLVTDIQMPEMDGYTLVRTLRASGSRLAAVALTAHAMSEDRQRCLDAGCDDYASKPIDRAALLKTCAAWLGKASPELAKADA